MANAATGNALLGVKPIYRGELRENHDCFWNQIDQICTDMALLDDKYIWPIMENAIYKKGFMEHHAYIVREQFYRQRFGITCTVYYM